MANLVELFDNIVQMQNLNGVPLAAGKLYVYALGRTRLMDSWSDVDGESLNPNPIILDDAGQAHVYVSDDFDYTLVVCDQYNNEIFSLDKYLYSKGSHSHADVAVAPSESIAVSSYHVGETTVYVPYLTGQLGKVYEGIDPIVVNNQVDKISANHVPLGVQDPLYFVQDDEEGCIIGCSAQTEIPSALSSKWDEASDVVIANSAQWSEGTTYEAGSYIDIDGHTINVTGLQPAGNYQSAGDYVVHDELSSYATQDWVNEQGFLTAHQDISNKLDVSAFSTVSGDFITAIPDNYATKDYVQSGLSSKLDSSSFSSVSSTFLTAHQSLDGLMSADLLEISDNKITGYNGTAFAGQGGGVTGDYELVAGSGVELVDDPDAHTTTINMTAEGTPTSAIEEMINSATSGKADKTGVVDYQPKPSADAIYAGGNTLANVGQIVGLNNSNFYIVPSGVLQVPNVITAGYNGLTVTGLTADPRYGLSANGITANTGGITANGLSANSVGGEFCIKCLPDAFSGGNATGFTFTSQNDAFGTAKLTTAVSNQTVRIPSPIFEARNTAGAGFSIEASAAKGYDHNGNVVWDTSVVPAPDRLISFAATQPAIIISPTPSSQSGYAPYLTANYQELAIKYNNGPSATMNLNGFSIKNGNNQVSIGAQGIAVTGSDVNLYVPEISASYSLRNSIQQSMIECDTATSAITAIAGSAIGGGGGVPQSAFDEATAKIAELENILSSYSGQWLLA